MHSGTQTQGKQFNAAYIFKVLMIYMKFPFVFTTLSSLSN